MYIKFDDESVDKPRVVLFATPKSIYTYSDTGCVSWEVLRIFFFSPLSSWLVSVYSHKVRWNYWNLSGRINTYMNNKRKKTSSWITKRIHWQCHKTAAKKRKLFGHILQWRIFMHKSDCLCAFELRNAFGAVVIPLSIFHFCVHTLYSVSFPPIISFVRHSHCVCRV